MTANQDFKDLFAHFNQEAVEYLVVGAHAVMYYAEPRYTKDLDIWVRPTRDNAKKVMRALSKFGAPLENTSIDDFVNQEHIFQIGVAPNRIDILMSIGSVDFESAYAGKTTSSYDDIPINVIGKQELIKAKKEINRLQDQIDVNSLEQ